MQHKPLLLNLAKKETLNYEFNLKQVSYNLNKLQVWLYNRQQTPLAHAYLRFL